MGLDERFNVMPSVGGELFTSASAAAAGLSHPRWAKITASTLINGVTMYTWIEMTPWLFTLVPLSGGMSGGPLRNPIIEVNGLALTVGSFVKVQPAYFDPVYDMVYYAVGVVGSSGFGGFEAEIESGSQPYAWTEQIPAATGGFVDKPGGRAGTTTVNPAYALNGSTTVAAGTVVTMFPWFLSGGSDGQNYAFVEAGAGGGLSSPLTTKGDIWIWTTTNARFPVGTNGQHIEADSTQTGGLKWVSGLTTTQTIVTGVVCNADGTITVTTKSFVWTNGILISVT